MDVLVITPNTKAGSTGTSAVIGIVAAVLVVAAVVAIIFLVRRQKLAGVVNTQDAVPLLTSIDIPSSHHEPGDTVKLNAPGSPDNPVISDFNNNFDCITGVAKAPLYSTLGEALRGWSIYEGDTKYSQQCLDAAVYTAMMFAKQLITNAGFDPTDPLAEDANGLGVLEIAALNLYTQESIYSQLNKLLNAKNERHKRLTPILPYMRLLFRALAKLPHHTDLGLVRGVKLDLCADASHYMPGQEFRWWGFTSCSLDAEVAKEFSRPAGGGVGTIFSIICDVGWDVSAYSTYNEEREVLLPPGITMVVKSCVQNAGGINFITVEHVKSVPILVQ